MSRLSIKPGSCSESFIAGVHLDGSEIEIAQGRSDLRCITHHHESEPLPCDVLLSHALSILACDCGNAFAIRAEVVFGQVVQEQLAQSYGQLIRRLQLER